MKTAILCHGLHLEANGWEDVMWGDSLLVLGRIPKAIFTASEFRAEILIFGSGASKDPNTGLFEGEIIRQIAYKRFNDEEMFKDIGDLNAFSRMSFVSEVESKNTFEEIRNAGSLCLRRGIERLILCSSPTHISQCMRDALWVLSQSPQTAHLTRNILAVASDTSYPGSNPEDVVIINPPHRGDRHLYPVHKVMKTTSRIARRSVEFCEELEKLNAKYENLLR